MRRFRQHAAQLAALSALLVIALLAGCAAVPAAAPAPAEGKQQQLKLRPKRLPKGRGSRSRRACPWRRPPAASPTRRSRSWRRPTRGGWMTARLLAQTLSGSGHQPRAGRGLQRARRRRHHRPGASVSQNAGDPYTIMMMGRVWSARSTNQVPVTLAESTPLAPHKPSTIRRRAARTPRTRPWAT